MLVNCAGCRTPMGEVTKAKLRKGWGVVCRGCLLKIQAETVRERTAEHEGPPGFLSGLFRKVKQ